MPQSDLDVLGDGPVGRSVVLHHRSCMIKGQRFCVAGDPPATQLQVLGGARPDRMRVHVRHYVRGPSGSSSRGRRPDRSARPGTVLRLSRTSTGRRLSMAVCCWSARSTRCERPTRCRRPTTGSTPEPTRLQGSLLCDGARRGRFRAFRNPTTLRRPLSLLGRSTGACDYGDGVRIRRRPMSD
jgi:hypothetical protein